MTGDFNAILFNNKLTIKSEGNMLSLLIHDGGFIVKTLTDEKGKFQAYRLRHRIFAQELQWIPQREDGLERDDYDKNAVHFGVFNEHKKLLAYLRLIMPDKYFMIEREFISLVGPEHKIRKERDTVEISRLCVSPEEGNNKIFCNFGVYNASIFLFKGVYQWCIRNNIRYLYAVAEQKVYRLFCTKGFPYKLIGKPKIMQDGVIAVAVIMDWKEFEGLNIIKRPKLVNWFTQCQSTPVQWQQQQPAAYL